jgi:hypothetical protein
METTTEIVERYVGSVGNDRSDIKIFEQYLDKVEIQSFDLRDELDDLRYGNDRDYDYYSEENTLEEILNCVTQLKILLIGLTCLIIFLFLYFIRHQVKIPKN